MIDVSKVPEQYRDYVCFLKKYCLKHKISFKEANKHLTCIVVAKESYGISDVREPSLLEVLRELKCDDVCEIIENAYDKKFARCYGAYIGYCEPSPHNPLCAQRMMKDEYIERSLDGNT